MRKRIEAGLRAHRLAVLGGFVPGPEDGLPAGTRALLLVGPGPGFWPHLTAQPEWGGPDPVDRFSRRVLGRLACDLGAKALFPFGGPPYHPFYRWALRSGRVWDSPVRLLVHAEQGLWVSFRGALALPCEVDLPPPAARPCDSCEGKPCLSACPAGALTAAGYDLPACHGFLDRPEGRGCMTQGCAVRAACPLSQGYDRMPEQSAWHMAHFHPGGRGMKRLILTRHAKSSWDDPLTPDHDRPLNERGKAAAADLGQWLASRGHVPEVVLCSDALRTRTTWSGIAPALPGTPLLEMKPALYHAGPDVMMAVLRHATADTVMMIGHNPGIAEFAHRLVARTPIHEGFRRYPTGATLVVDFDVESWKDAEYGRGATVDFVVPRELVG